MSDQAHLAESIGIQLNELRREMAKVIIGQEIVLEHLLTALLADGHCFMVGVPGLAKTLMVSTLAKVLDLDSKRIQFTPDLMPSDITGTEIMQEDPTTGAREFIFHPGPVFTNLLLADEVNRTPPKTQAALLEAMQERQVTYGGRSLKLEAPFFVLATQNPVEQEGTYPLPEAQLDRFMFSVAVNYPSESEEMAILKRTTVPMLENVKVIMDRRAILKAQELVRRIPVADHVFKYVLQLVRSTRPDEGQAPEFIRQWVEVGAGPRAGQFLILGAKARSLLHGRLHATCSDVRMLAGPVLRHRIIPSFDAEAEGVDSDVIVDRLLESFPAGKD